MWTMRAACRLALVFACITAFTAQAQGPRVLSTPAAVGNVIAIARGEVLVGASSLRQRAVAESLHAAAVRRGATVYLLLDRRFVREPASYADGLSLTKKIQIRVLENVQSNIAIVDRQTLIRGSLLVDDLDPAAPQSAITTASANAAEINRATRWFIASWKRAQPYRYGLR